MVMFIDSAERNEYITDILTENGVPFKIKRLPVADYVWNDYAIERKSINDFVSSISNNHIFDQLEDLVHNLSLGASRCALVMHGDLKDLEWRYLKCWSVPIFYKHLGEIFTHYPNVGFFWVENEEAFAVLLTAMYHQSFSKKTQHFNFVKKTKRDDINTLIASKHFSMNQAKTILKKYSLRQIFNMELSKMIKLKGFGKIGVNKFIKFRE